MVRAYGLAVFYLCNVIFSKQDLLNVPLGNDNTELCSFRPLPPLILIISNPSAPVKNISSSQI